MVGPLTDLAFTSLGVPYVGYKRWERLPDAGFWVMHLSGSSWVHELVTGWGMGGAGEPRLALDWEEKPSVAWGSAGIPFAHQ